MGVSDQKRLQRLMADAEWNLSKQGGTNPLEHSDISREEFADKVVLIMGDRDLEPAERLAEIDTLLFNATKSAATKLARQQYERGEGVDDA